MLCLSGMRLFLYRDRQEAKRRESIFLDTMVTWTYCTFEVSYDPLGEVFTALSLGVPNSFNPDITHPQDVVRRWRPDPLPTGHDMVLPVNGFTLTLI